VNDFWAALSTHPFLQRALAAAMLASVASGVVGSYVVARRITAIAGGISHCLLGGMGVARYLQVTRGWDWLQPLHGAVVAAIVAAVIIGVVSIRWNEREDTVISALWAVGMAVGVLFISRTPGYGQDLMSYLFGNILMVSSKDLWLVAGLDAVVIALAVAFHEQLLGVCFDDEFARIRGVRAEGYYLLLLGLTALTVVLLVTVVGLVMVIALLSLPAAIGMQLGRSLRQVMVVATALSAAFTISGLVLSYGADLPAGATSIVIAGMCYLVVLAGVGLVRRLRKSRTPAA